MTIQTGMAALALSLPVFAYAQDAVQWRVEDGGNGHWYRVMRDLGDTTYQGWRVSLTAQGGHLATMSSVAEHQFALNVAIAQGGVPPAFAGWAIFGAFREAGSTEWRWVTGEPMVYSAWSPGEPNAALTDFAYTQMWGANNQPTLVWDDNSTRIGIARAIAEWSADCNGDGIVDYGQLLDGTLPDTNANGVPDCCDTGTSCTPCEGDVTGNGIIDGVDLAAVLGDWGFTGKGEFATDVNGDGTVDASDLAMVLSGWGPCPD